MISKEVYWIVLQLTRSVVLAAIVATTLLALTATAMGTKVIQLAWPYPYGSSYILIRSAIFTRFIKWIVKQFDASVHSPMINLGENNETRRIINRREVMETIRYARDCGVKLITLHLADNDWDDSWPIKHAIKTPSNPAASIKSFGQILNETVHYSHRVIIALENLSEPEFQTVESFKRFFGQSGYVGLTLDIAHAISQNLDPVKLIEDYKNNLKVVHLTTTIVSPDQINGSVKHYAYDAKGVYDLTAVLEKLIEIGFDGPIIMEVDLWDLPRSWLWLRRKGFV